MSVGRKKLSVCEKNVAAFACCETRKYNKRLNTKSYFSTSMVFSFILNDWNLLAFLQSLKQRIPNNGPLQTKQFCPCFVFSRGLNIEDYFQELQYIGHTVRVRTSILQRAILIF